MPARLVPIAIGRTAGAVSGLAESGLVHRLVRGRLWIGALATLLIGIVALNVLALSFNATASRTGLQTDVLKRQISTLRAQIAAAGASNERVQAEARRLGLIVPEPGSITYLAPNADDAATAARRLTSGELVAGVPNTPVPAPASSAPPATETTATVPPPAAESTDPAVQSPPASSTATNPSPGPTSAPSAGSTPTVTTGSVTSSPAPGGGASAGGGVAAP
jgi:hypothetical protein